MIPGDNLDPPVSWHLQTSHTEILLEGAMMKHKFEKAFKCYVPSLWNYLCPELGVLLTTEEHLRRHSKTASVT